MSDAALKRLAHLAGFIREVRLGQAAAARATREAVAAGLADRDLIAAPAGANAATAAQHARWAAARRAALRRALTHAEAEDAVRQAAARRAVGVDSAIAGLVDARREDLARKARRG